MNNANEKLDEIAGLMAANTTKVLVLCARAMVLATFLKAVLPHLTTLQRTEVTWPFRQGIEEAVSLMDDLALPAEYHSALFELTNAILASLGQEPTRRQ
ncbi:hypothetical protein [Paraburkholderia terrae]|uniref:Uncharacterized protein n=1 Tax=Paraburkholderia terrae TaxID=311230 RepID=A0A2I8F4C1_9BURK|nr:hypothetical protein [Paraburkholderia terrae]AUT66391.1 hypothetical protein C2L65_42570 [Paraburkholderia terrae]